MLQATRPLQESNRQGRTGNRKAELLNGRQEPRVCVEGKMISKIKKEDCACYGQENFDDHWCLMLNFGKWRPGWLPNTTQIGFSAWGMEMGRSGKPLVQCRVVQTLFLFGRHCFVWLHFSIHHVHLARVSQILNMPYSRSLG